MGTSPAEAPSTSISQWSTEDSFSCLSGQSRQCRDTPIKRRNQRRKPKKYKIFVLQLGIACLFFLHLWLKRARGLATPMKGSSSPEKAGDKIVITFRVISDFINTTYDISLDSQISLLPLGFSLHLLAFWFIFVSRPSDSCTFKAFLGFFSSWMLKD